MLLIYITHSLSFHYDNFKIIIICDGKKKCSKELFKVFNYY